ncbi:MAG TPA: hypothetical protein DDZ80_23155 [Cyanobacteria bacterium UBA8803]|nr:hypothetical protein [Cyanobacteria bacterium UBA9273]HBL61225.1 hypothetical protein [Cyanobacteria bacterium UBA8803]
MIDTIDKPLAYVAFQGGGALGMAHLGAWQVISQHFQIVGTAGTSSGSIVAALCAAGFTPDEAIERFNQLNWSDYVKPKSWWKLWTERNAYYDGKHFQEWLKEQLSKGGNRGRKKVLPKLPNGDVTFANLYEFTQIYLAIVACDLHDEKAKPIVFDKDRLSDYGVSFAVRASISIPGFFEPLPLSGRSELLVDGGFLLNFPVEFLYEPANNMDGRHVIIGVRFKQRQKYLDAPNIIEILKATGDLMIRRGSLPPDYIKEKENYIDVAINVDDFNSLNFKLTPQQKTILVTQGENAAQKALIDYLESDKAKAGQVLNKIQSQMQARLDANTNEKLYKAVNWLSGKEKFVERVRQAALRKFSRLGEIDQRIKENIDNKLGQYIERIEYYIRDNYEFDYLTEPPKPTFIDVKVYIEALELLKNEIPPHLDNEVIQKIKEGIDFLKVRLSNYITD